MDRAGCSNRANVRFCYLNVPGGQLRHPGLSAGLGPLRKAGLSAGSQSSNAGDSIMGGLRLRFVDREELHARWCSIATDTQSVQSGLRVMIEAGLYVDVRAACRPSRGTSADMSPWAERITSGKI